MSRWTASRPADRAIGATLGVALDRLLGEPPHRVHPLVGFGNAMNRVETALWSDGRLPGVFHAAAGTLLGAGSGQVLHGGMGLLQTRSTRVRRRADDQDPGGALLSTRAVASTALACAAATGGRSLDRAAASIEALLRTGDLENARAALPTLVGRDPEGLSESQIAAAVIESVAENTVDAVVAPYLAAVAAGASGTLAYRAINTMDAMVGHRNERYQRYGWAPARLDDAANWIPARLTVLATALANPRTGRTALRTARRDGPSHPSPNAGLVEAAAAGSLSVRLGGPLAYGGRTEQRPTLGTGRAPLAADITRARRLATRTQLIAILLVDVAACTADRAVRRDGSGRFGSSR